MFEKNPKKPPFLWATDEETPLRKSLESKEGITYVSNIAFELDASLQTFDNIPALSIDNCKIVYFDLETSGRDNLADILQIAAIVD